MKYLVALLAMLSISISTVQANHAQQQVAATLSGIVTKAKDGDGIMFGKVEVRLLGVAAPENNRILSTPEGVKATLFLDQLIHNKFVICHLDGSVASYGRDVGTCYLDGVDLGGLMVEQGYAMACEAYSTAYLDEQNQATEARLNILLHMFYVIPAYC